MVKQCLIDFGLKTNKEEKISLKRVIGSFLEEEWFNDLLKNENDLEKWISNNIYKIHNSILTKNKNINWSIDKDNFETVIRNHIGPDDKYSMDWHFDNCTIIKQSKEFAEKNKLSNLTLIKKGDGKYNTYLYTGLLPKYTLIIYLKSDCVGGEFCFLDKEIKPQKGLFVLFSGYDLHSVKPLIKGHRIAVIIKIF